MTRRTRRRVYVVLVAALAGVSAPVWAPPLLARLPTFRAEEVGVVGARFVPPDQIMELARVDSAASVWDDPSAWERRVRAHPLVRDARVRRAGFHRLEIEVTEVEPVALVPTPEPVPVDRRGRVLPLDPVRSRLDLPVLGGTPRIEDDSLADPRSRRLLEVLVELRREEPGFVAEASEIVPAPDHGVEVFLLRSGACERVLLPFDRPVRALRRVEMALGQHRGRGPVRTADARFDGQVVLRPEGDA